MITQIEKAEGFRDLHVKGEPLILFNIWDAGGAKAVEEAGAKAIATGSWAVAAANGFSDGENVSLEFVLANVERIAASVGLPVTLDFEGGYTSENSELERNIERVIAAGAVGINFEDQVVGGEGLYSIEDQCGRIKAIRAAADRDSLPLFINARTDIFLKTYPAKEEHAQLDGAIERSRAYAKAGASGLFVPGLRDAEFIRKVCELSPIPVNIMVMPEVPPNKELAELGVARISYGAGPYREIMEALRSAAISAFSYHQ